MFQISLTFWDNMKMRIGTFIETLFLTTYHTHNIELLLHIFTWHPEFKLSLKTENSLGILG